MHQVAGTKYQGTRDLVLVPGTSYLVLVPSARYLVPITSYQVHGTINLVADLHCIHMGAFKCVRFSAILCSLTS